MINTYSQMQLALSNVGAYQTYEFEHVGSFEQSSNS
jgi:hypothetical protein